MILHLRQFHVRKAGAYARQIADFCERFGWEAGSDGWALMLGGDGEIKRGHESTYVDAFAIYGLVELHRATGDEAPLRLARRTGDAALKKLARPRDQVAHFPYPILAGTTPRAILMVWSLTFAELGEATADARYLEASAQFTEEIFRDFFRPARDLVLETVRLDGSEFGGPEGRAVVPGHVLEDIWFQFHIADLLGRGSARDELLRRLILRNMELGWDRERGGLRLAVDADGRNPVGWNFAEAKLWWPHTEALYATLLGWEQTKEPAFFDWYEKLWGVCLEHYVDWEHGEWRQRLDADLKPFKEVVALPVKDPFHLPRSLILQIELLKASRHRA